MHKFLDVAGLRIPKEDRTDECDSKDVRLTPRQKVEARVVIISQGPGADWLNSQKLSKGGRLENLILLPYQPFCDFPKMLGAGEVLIAVLERPSPLLEGRVTTVPPGY